MGDGGKEPGMCQPHGHLCVHVELQIGTERTDLSQQIHFPKGGGLGRTPWMPPQKNRIARGGLSTQVTPPSLAFADIPGVPDEPKSLLRRENGPHLLKGPWQQVVVAV